MQLNAATFGIEPSTPLDPDMRLSYYEPFDFLSFEQLESPVEAFTDAQFN